MFQPSHSNANIFKQRRLMRMEILRHKRLKPSAVPPKLATRRGCMIFDYI
jgi:hypothetical protein